jgi:hypothetical protein
VRRVILPVLANRDEPRDLATDDIEYVRDLGLISPGPRVRIANQIYREVIPRELVWGTQQAITHQATWYVGGDGRLNVVKLLAAFQDFFRLNSEHWLERFAYREAGPQLLLQAFLQRIVNGGGRIEREYGLGRRRTDLLIIWPHAGGVQRAVLQVKVTESLGPELLAEGLAQTGDYMDKAGATEGHLLLFDRRPGLSWEARLYRRTERDPSGREITVWGA